jgi:hypothetical protein
MQAHDPKSFDSDIYKFISKKYDRLILAISQKISGDVATSSLEDNYADLWLAVFEAIEGFTKQNNYANGPIEDWLDSKPFDKYLKTCLWNKKNHKGKLISNKYEIHRDTVPTHLEEVLNVSSPDSSIYFDILGELGVSLSVDEKKLVECVVAEPDRFITEEGKVKIAPIQKSLGWTRKGVEVVLDNMKKKIYLDRELGI